MEARGEYDAITHIRDPVHDEIGISKVEREVLDSEPVQRLRQIQQLGPVTRVYPSATHTRFTHSLGVMHVAGVLGNMLELPDEQVTAVRIAGLLHDTGHGPFSHTSEEVAGRAGFEHEARSCKLARDICDDLPVDTDEVIAQISGQATPNLVASVVDADRLDYLVRDSLFTAVDHGLVDVNSILRFSRTVNGELGFDKKAVPSLNSMLSARLRMRRVVYRYSTVRHFATLLRRALEDFANENGVETMMKHDDYTMHSALVDSQNPFYEQVTTRDLGRKSLSFGTGAFSRDEMRALGAVDETTVREAVCDALGITTDRVLVSPPYIPENVPRQTRILDNGRATTLEEFSRFPNHIYDEAWNETTLVVYVDNPDDDAAHRVRSVLRDLATE